MEIVRQASVEMGIKPQTSSSSNHSGGLSHIISLVSRNSVMTDAEMKDEVAIEMEPSLVEVRHGSSRLGMNCCFMEYTC